MKGLLLVISFFVASIGYGQTHILPCGGSGSHTNSRCHGWATGRSFGKSVGDAVCNPANLYVTEMHQTYFQWNVCDTESVLQTKRIIGWGTNGRDHVARREHGA